MFGKHAFTSIVAPAVGTATSDAAQNGVDPCISLTESQASLQFRTDLITAGTGGAADGKKAEDDKKDDDLLRSYTLLLRFRMPVRSLLTCDVQQLISALCGLIGGCGVGCSHDV